MKMTKKIAAFASTALLVAAMGLAGCASPQEGSSAESSAAAESTENAPEEEVIEQIEVPVKVTSPAANDQVTYDETVTIGEGDTVQGALEATGLEIDASPSEYGIFVNSIEGLANEGMKGWTFTVNGEQVQSAADQINLKDGDTVEWSYIDMEA